MRSTSSFLKPAHAEAYAAGYDAKNAEIAALGWTAARTKFNAENPHGVDVKSVGAYFYAEGEMDALVDAKSDRYHEGA